MKPGLKNALMRVINLLLYLSFCGLVGTGALLTWKLMPGSRGGGGLTASRLDPPQLSAHQRGNLLHRQDRRQLSEWRNRIGGSREL